MRAAARPNGSRLSPGSGVKLKAVNIVPAGANAAASWALMFGQYPAQNMASRLATVKSYGANAVKVTCGGLTEPSGATFPPDAQLYAYIADFCANCRALRLKIYLGLNNSGIQFTSTYPATGGGSLAPNVAVNIKVLGWWMALGRDLVVAVDVCNEVNFNGPTTWPSNGTVNAQMTSDLSYIVAQIKAAAPGLPVTFSVYMQSRTGFNNALLQLQSMTGCTYHGYHPYYGLNGSTSLATTDAPASADMAQLEAQPWFLGSYLAGEFGMENTNSAAALTTGVQGLGAQGGRPASRGFVLFSDVNFVSSSETGNYGIAGVSALTSPLNGLGGST